MSRWRRTKLERIQKQTSWAPPCLRWRSINCKEPLSRPWSMCSSILRCWLVPGQFGLLPREVRPFPVPRVKPADNIIIDHQRSANESRSAWPQTWSFFSRSFSHRPCLQTTFLDPEASCEIFDRRSCRLHPDHTVSDFMGFYRVQLLPIIHKVTT